jgi:hypothetical protein
MLGRLREYPARRREAARDVEERAFFEEWDRQGRPDHHPVTGEEVPPTKDPETGAWVYGHRAELYPDEERPV